eukprot:scaffold8247_cov130-Cylindrotheca_fusiformis.AAC.1
MDESKIKYSKVVVWDRSYFLGSSDGSTTIIRWLDANKFHSLCLLEARESIPRSLFAIDQISEAGMVVSNNHLARIEVLQDQPIMLTKDGSDFRIRNVVRKNYP